MAIEKVALIDLIWIAMSLFVFILCAMAGADLTFLFIQILTFLTIPVILRFIKNIDAYSATILLISTGKMWFISQVACAIMFRAPDLGLSSATRTAACIVIGIIGTLFGIGVGRILFWFTPGPLLKFPTGRVSIYLLGVRASAVGLVSQLVWTIFAGSFSADQRGGLASTLSGMVVFAYMTPLTFLGLSCIGYSNYLSTNKRTIFSVQFFLVLFTYIVLITPLASKAEPLKPIVAISLLALILKWRPTVGTAVSALAVLLFVSQVLYPVTTVARLNAARDRAPLPVVYLETLVGAVFDPKSLQEASAGTQNYDLRTGKQYFGVRAGFLDRFTPLPTDRLVTGAEYIEQTGLADIIDSAQRILPQSLGFKRDIQGAQLRLEIAMARRSLDRGQLGWENTGYFGSAYLASGFFGSFLFMAIFGFVASAASKLTFGWKGGYLLWIPYVIAFMLVPADDSFQGSAPVVFWGWVFLSAAIWLIIATLPRTGTRRLRASP